MEPLRINQSMRTNAVKPINYDPLRPAPRHPGVKVHTWLPKWQSREGLLGFLMPKQKATSCGWCPSNQ